MIQVKKPFVAVLTALMICGNLSAQEAFYSLSDLLSLSDSGCVRICSAQTAVSSARERQAAVAHTTLLPDLRFAASVGHLGDGRGWGRDSNYSFLVPMPHFSTRFGIEAQQVLFSGGGQRAERQKAQLQVSLSQLQFEQLRQDVRLQIVGLYLDLYGCLKQMVVLDSNIALTRRLMLDIQAKRKQGLALQNDLTRHELQLANLQQQQSALQNNMDITNNTIVNLVGLPAGTRIVPDSSFFSIGLSASERVPIQVKAARAEVDLAQTEVLKAQSEMFPTLSLVAQDQLTGPVTIDITPYDINYNYWFVGLALNYNVSSAWKSPHALHAVRLNHLQRQLDLQACQDDFQLSLNNAVMQLSEANRNLQTKHKSLLLAQENYTLVANRYAADLALLVDMIDAANQKLAAELDLIGARLEAEYCIFKIHYLNGIL